MLKKRIRKKREELQDDYCQSEREGVKNSFTSIQTIRISTHENKINIDKIKADRMHKPMLHITHTHNVS